MKFWVIHGVAAAWTVGTYAGVMGANEVTAGREYSGIEVAVAIGKGARGNAEAKGRPRGAT